MPDSQNHAAQVIEAIVSVNSSVGHQLDAFEKVRDAGVSACERQNLGEPERIPPEERDFTAFAAACIELQGMRLGFVNGAASNCFAEACYGGCNYHGLMGESAHEVALSVARYFLEGLTYSLHEWLDAIDELEPMAETHGTIDPWALTPAVAASYIGFLPDSPGLLYALKSDIAKNINSLRVQLLGEFLRAIRIAQTGHVLAAEVGEHRHGVRAALPAKYALLWNALEGRRATAGALARELGLSDEVVRKRVEMLRKFGCEVENQRDGTGYYRPDAPPAEL
jgi:biotin operon repressor